MILSLHTYSQNPLQSLSATPRSLNYMTDCYSETATHTLILPPRSAQISSLSLSPLPKTSLPGTTSLGPLV